MAGKDSKKFDRGVYTPRSTARIEIEDLPYFAHPITEKIHELKPNIIVAGDRGGRLLGLTVMKSWRHLYGQEAFPTIGRRINFARVTGRSAREKAVQKLVRFALDEGGLKQCRQENIEPKVMYLDDWAVHGGTIERFVSGAVKAGVKEQNIIYATTCGKKVDGVNHLVADPTVDFRRAAWDREGGSSRHVGIRYEADQPTLPIADMNYDAVETRIAIGQYVDAYYATVTRPQMSNKNPVLSLLFK